MCATNLIMNKMSKRKREDSEFDSVSMSDNEVSKDPSTHNTSQKLDSSASIDQQSIDKCMFSPRYAANQKFIERMRRDSKQTGNEILRNLMNKEYSYPLPQDKSSVCVEMISHCKAKNEQDAVTQYNEILNTLLQNRLVQETMKFKQQRLERIDDTLSTEELIEQLLCVNAPLLPETIQKMKSIFDEKVSIVLFRNKPYILFYGK